jgi:3-hydroxyacyl-CoA dehydrogenase
MNQAILTQALGESLLTALDWIENHGDSFVLTQEKKGDFCYGADLKTFLQYSNQLSQIDEYLNTLHQLNQRLVQTSLITVGKAQGYALGGGFEILRHMKFQLISPKIHAGFVEFKFNLLPSTGGLKFVFEALNRPNMSLNTRLNLGGKWFQAFLTSAFSQNLFELFELNLLNPENCYICYEQQEDLSEALALVAVGRRQKELITTQVKEKSLQLGLPLFNRLVAELRQHEEINPLSPIQKNLAEKIIYLISGGTSPVPKEIKSDEIFRFEKQVFMEQIKQKDTISLIEKTLTKRSTI